MITRIKNTRRSSRRRGISLVELMIAGALFALVLGSITAVSQSSDRAYRTGAIAAALESQVSITMDRIVRELLRAGIGTVSPNPGPIGSSDVSYLQAVDYDQGQVEWTLTRRLRFEYEAGEVNDGLDNNDNGLVDEGRIVLITDEGETTERRLVLTRWVSELEAGETLNGLDDNQNNLTDESGFRLALQGNTLIVTISLARLDGEGRLLTRTARSSVKLRN